MRQATQPIAIASSGKQRSTVDSRSGNNNLSGDSGMDSSGDEEEYYHPPLRDRPYGQPFTHRNQPDMMQTNTNMEDLLLVGSLPSSRRERRFIVSSGGQEVGGYGHSTAAAAAGSNTRLVFAPRAWNHPASRQRVNSSPPPAPLLESRKDQERGDPISRIPKMALPESLATSLDSSSIRMSYGSLRENSFQRYYQQGLNQPFTVIEPKSLPYVTRNGSSADIFSRLHSNNSIHNLKEDPNNNGDEDNLTTPVPIQTTTNKVGSVSALASLLGDYTIGEAGSSSPIDKIHQVHGFDRDELSLRGCNAPEATTVHSTGTWSYSSHHSADLWNLNSNPDLTMVQSPTLSGHDDFSATSSLTGLNILESTHNDFVANLETHHSHVDTMALEAASMLHSTSLDHSSIGTEYKNVNSHEYYDPIDSGQQGAFDLEMDR